MAPFQSRLGRITSTIFLVTLLLVGTMSAPTRSRSRSTAAYQVNSIVSDGNNVYEGIYQRRNGAYSRGAKENTEQAELHRPTKEMNLQKSEDKSRKRFQAAELNFEATTPITDFASRKKDESVQATNLGAEIFDKQLENGSARLTNESFNTEKQSIIPKHPHKGLIRLRSTQKGYPKYVVFCRHIHRCQFRNCLCLKSRPQKDAGGGFILNKFRPQKSQYRNFPYSRTDPQTNKEHGNPFYRFRSDRGLDYENGRFRNNVDKLHLFLSRGSRQNTDRFHRHAFSTIGQHKTQFSHHIRRYHSNIFRDNRRHIKNYRKGSQRSQGKYYRCPLNIVFPCYTVKLRKIPFNKSWNYIKDSQNTSVDGSRNHTNSNFKSASTFKLKIKVRGRFRYKLKHTDRKSHHKFQELSADLDQNYKPKTKYGQTKSIIANGSLSISIQTESASSTNKMPTQTYIRHSATSQTATDVNRNARTFTQKMSTTPYETSSPAPTTLGATTNFNEAGSSVTVASPYTNYEQFTRQPTTSIEQKGTTASSRATTRDDQPRVGSGYKDLKPFGSLKDSERRKDENDTIDNTRLDTLLADLQRSTKDLATCEEKLHEKVIGTVGGAVQKVFNDTQEHTNNTGQGSITTTTTTLNTTTTPDISNLTGTKTNGPFDDRENVDGNPGDISSSASLDAEQDLFDTLTQLSPGAVDALDKNYSVQVLDEMGAGTYQDGEDMIPMTNGGQPVLFQPGIQVLDYSDENLPLSQENQTMPADPVGEEVKKLLLHYKKYANSRGLKFSDEVLERLKKDVKATEQALSFCQFAIENVGQS